MYTRLGDTVSDWFTKAMRVQLPKIAMPKTVLQLGFIPWFSIAGFSTVVLFCVSFGAVLTHYLTREILDQDVVLTSQFIESVNRVESLEAGLGTKVRLGQLLDRRVDVTKLGVDIHVAEVMRTQFYHHISTLPDLLLVNVYSPDNTIIWSTNQSLIGKVGEDPGELNETLAKRSVLANDYFDGKHHKENQQFAIEQGTPYFESYIPLLSRKGEVAAVVEIYKQPQELLQTIHRGSLLIWICITLGALFLYVAPFWIFRRADSAIKEQHQRLCEAQTLCIIGEMSASVAHSIRNPLSSIRTSAELALDADLPAARKNAEDIICQVDRLGKWVRDLLVFSRPVSGETQKVNLVSLLDECLPNFVTQMQQSHIIAEFIKPVESLPLVVGNHALATQALASIVCNAIESMPSGGLLQLQFQVSPLRNYVDLLVSDTGIGMTPAQIELAFKPFYTTKRNGVGLGVAQVKRIMERFGGVLYLKSRLGHGTQACLRFTIA